MPALCTFQFHMIVHIDDCCKFLKENLTSNRRFPFTLAAKLCWSKNVKEEREAPKQVLIGSMSTIYCVLLTLAVHLETSIESSVSQTSRFVFDIQTDSPKNAKNRAYRILRDDVWAKSEFEKVVTGLIGTHSLRKYPSTHAQRNGCSRDDIDFRGRWKRHTRQVDTYIDVELPYPDAKVAAALCIGGACKYVIKESNGVSDSWLLQYVVPNICTEYACDVALVLAPPLLWAVFEPTLQGYLPQSLTRRIKAAYEIIYPLQQNIDNNNPVERRLIVVNGSEAQVYIDEVGADVEAAVDNSVAAGGTTKTTTTGEGQGGQQARAAGHSRNEILGLYSQQRETQHGMIQLQAQVGYNQVTVMKEIKKMQTTLSRMSRMPSQRLAADNQTSTAASTANVVCNASNNEQVDATADPDMMDVEDGGSNYVSSLSKAPKTLFLLWQEFEVGIGGRKAARLLTRVERGRVKVQYCRRRVVWDTVAALVRAGFTAHTAIDKIYEVYGQDKTVTQIVNEMMRDRCTGASHPQLRI